MYTGMHGGVLVTTKGRAELRNPIQPLHTVDRVVRFKSNKLVDALYAHGLHNGMGLNELAVMFAGPEHDDDRRQFAQLIGYSLNGYCELPYVDDETYLAAAHMVTQKTTEDQARAAVLRQELDDLRDAIREPMARLFGVHPDDLGGNE